MRGSRPDCVLIHLVIFILGFKDIISEETSDQLVICEVDNYCVINHEPEKQHTPGENITFTWYKDEDPVSECSTSGKCKTYRGHVFSVSSNYTRKGHLSLSILSKIRENGTVWSLMKTSSYNITHLISRWQLRIYKKALNARCYVEEKQSLKLSCDVPLSYRCHFKDLNAKNDVEANHEYSIVQDDPNHLFLKCSISLSITQQTHEFKYNVTMYPYLTNSTKDRMYGSVLYVAFKIEQPTVQFSCNAELNEGEVFVCVCIKSDASNLTTQVWWYYKDILLSKGNDMAILEEIAQLNRTEFFCVGSNAMGWRSEPLIYETKVRALVDLSSYTCPNATQRLCGRHGLCYYHYEICTKDYKVESCFPNKTDVLKWCREIGVHNNSMMKDKQCENACWLRFSNRELYDMSTEETTGTATFFTVSFVTIPSLTITVLIVFFLRKYCQRCYTRFC